ncbi:MAG: SDR family NAD(P)-dependent oxidoreductase [Deltaproteobacteria bacterium]|nr:SDR family NAD(P)-dependent oxidoreductase [Kofleriaceae bacterium]
MGELSGQRALVTGASGGIGAEIARALARRGAALVLCARRGAELEELAAELRKAHGVAADVVVADLSVPGAAMELWGKATAGGPVDILVNNAGFGHFRPFGDIALERETEMLRLNIIALVELSHAFVAAHRDRPPEQAAYLMNVASIAAWQPVPHFATYAASKVFVRNFSEALHLEQKGKAVRVHCLCPGGTHTEFHATAGAGNYGKLANASMLSAADVAEQGVRAMLRGKKTLVTGVLNKLSCFFTGMSPRGVTSRASMFVMGKPRRDALPATTSSAKLPAGDKGT